LKSTQAKVSGKAVPVLNDLKNLASASTKVPKHPKSSPNIPNHAQTTKPPKYAKALSIRSRHFCKVCRFLSSITVNICRGFLRTFKEPSANQMKD